VAGPSRAACLPLPPVVLKDDGEACTTSEECTGGTCLTDPDFPSGYCTTANCRAEFDCARQDSDNRCFAVEGENRWVRLRLTNAALRLIDKKGIDVILADLRARGQAV
jgi:hypothetical protein